MSNIQRVTPFISPIRTQGGTLYTFTSAAEDLTLSFNSDSNRKFKFSKFALLNIPDILNDPIKNTIKFRAIPGAYNSVNFDRTNDYNNHLAESFQNYCLNLETVLRSRDTYDAVDEHTVSERVFFKWLKELAAIRFQSIDNLTTTQEQRYIEEISSNKYNRVVEYIGNIDFINNYSGQDSTYSEVYVHIPTEVGNFPNVYFKTYLDDNYYPGMALCRTDANPEDSEVLYGRNYNDDHPAGLAIQAFYDNDSGLGSGSLVKQFKKKLDKRDDETVLCVGEDCDQDYTLDSWWYYSSSESNCYYTEPIEFGNPLNDDLAIVRSGSVNVNEEAVKFRRSKLDGIEIDFDENTYRNSELGIESLIDNARSGASKDFKFNAVLVYYDLYQTVITADNDDAYEFVNQYEEGFGLENQYSTPDIDVISTNLYGVLFLDNVENFLSLGGGYIPRLKKCRPNEVLGLNGNAYGFKINLKLDVSPIDTGVSVETIISNSNTLSMDIYANALNVMRNSMENLQNLTFENLSFDQRIRQLETFNLYKKETTLTELSNKIKNIEEILRVNGNIDIIKRQNEILQMVIQNKNLIDSILDGSVSTDVRLDLGFFKQGPGILLDKTNENQIVFSSLNSNFIISDKSRVSVQDDFQVNEYEYFYETDLNDLKNYLRIEENRNFLPNKDIKLYIKNSSKAWTKGQIYRIYFAHPYHMLNQYGRYDFYIYTIIKGKYTAVKKITSYDFEVRNYRPVLELICTDAENLTFYLDFLN